MIFEVFRETVVKHLEDWLVHGRRVWRRDGLTSQNADNSVTKMTSCNSSSTLATADSRWYCVDLLNLMDMRYNALLHMAQNQSWHSTGCVFLCLTSASHVLRCKDIPEKVQPLTSRRKIHFTSSPSWQWLAV